MPRKPSASAHEKVLRAALELVSERGIDATSMDAIAQKSGVSKATIYKHWADKDALLIEMLAMVFGLQGRPSFDSGDTKADLIAILAHHPAEDAEMREKIRPHLMSYSLKNPAFGQAWRNMVMEPPRRELRHLLKLGIRKGELAPDLDMELSLALLLGPILYWHVFLRKSSEDPMPVAGGTVEAFWKAFAVKKKAVRS